MAIDDNTSYELTGAQVKDLAARIKAGGGGGMTVYVDASFATPSSITGVFSDSALTTPADPDAMAGIISAGSTVIVVYDGGQSEEVIELSSINSNSRFPEVGQAFTSIISTNAIFSAPTTVTLLYDGTLDSWSVETAPVPTKTSDITNDGDDGVHPFLATDDVATVATTGAYSDLSGTPSLATVATSGSYDDLSNKPTIPTVNNATLTIQKNGTTVNTFTANASSNVTANISVPTQFSNLSGTVSTSQIAANAVTTAKLETSTWVNGSYKSGYKASTNTSYKQNIQATIVGRMLYIRFGVSPSSGSFAKDTEYTFGSIPSTVNGVTVSDLCTSAKQNLPRFLCSGQYGMYGWCQLNGTNLSLSFNSSMGASCGWMCGQLMIPIDY